MGLNSDFSNGDEQWRTADWRRGRDSNPRYPVKGTTVFETAPIDHSGTSPRSAMGEVGLRKPPLPEGRRSLPQGTRAPQRAGPRRRARRRYWAPPFRERIDAAVRPTP